MRKFAWFSVFVLSVYCGAETQSWKIDPNHTASQFAVRHMGISTVRGMFEKTTGTVNYDPADPARTSIDVSIDANSVNTRVQMRDNDLRSPHFLDVAKFPTITFKSTHAESAGSGRLKVTGDLTIHGVTKQVVLDVDGPSQEIKDPMGNLRTGANATTKIDRKDFGITADPGVVGDEIQITLDVELTRPAK
ncbi:MAG TPA: YceI family protein [Terriglobales bacterium]|nr:YceI family protein [Terriglobales bacterium]